MQPQLKTIESLTDLVVLPRSLKQAAIEIENSEDPRLRVPVFLKYALRCLTSCMRAMTAVVAFINSEANGLGNVLDFMEFTKDEEV